MAIYPKIFTLVSSFCFFAISTNQVPASAIANTPCKSIGVTKKSDGKTYLCTKNKSKMIWVLKQNIQKSKNKSNISSKTDLFPDTKPELIINWDGMIIKATAVLPSNEVIISKQVIGVQARLKFGPVPLSINDSVSYISTGDARINFQWDLSTVWNTLKSQPWQIYVESELLNSSGKGPTNIKMTALPDLISTPQPAPTPTPQPTSSASPAESVNQSNARKAAERYLKSFAYSRNGLIKQLQYEGFSNADAQYGVDAQKVNWNQQAVKSAQTYLKSSSFSYKSLLAQLIYEGFTPEEAAFGVDSTGLTNQTPATAPTVSPTPPPTATSVNTQPTAKCTPNYLDSLPFSSQRIALTEMSWEKDQNGYVFALATLRNDLSTPLRLVEFSFAFYYDLELVKTQTSLRGFHYFVKDDSTLNSFDKTPGPWIPGQSRIFKLESNRIMDCSKIYVFGNRFTVSQGIGDS